MNNQNDENLMGNEKIEEAVLALQNNPCDELLAHALTVIRRRMREGGHLILAVDSKVESQNLQLRILNTDDGKKWFYAFTSFDEQVKGSEAIMSGFTAHIGKLLRLSLDTAEVEGLIINPWNRTIMLDKEWIRIIFGEI